MLVNILGRGPVARAGEVLHLAARRRDEDRRVLRAVDRIHAREVVLDGVQGHLPRLPVVHARPRVHADDTRAKTALEAARKAKDLSMPCM